MNKRYDSPWAPDFEQVRRQRGPRGHHGHGRGYGPGFGGPPPWVAQMFGPQWGPTGGGRGGRRG